MIFTAVGTQKFQFNRILKSIDVLVGDGIITEEVYAQIGYSDYKPNNYGYIDFIDKNKFESFIERCDLLITHGGVATIMAGIQHNKPVIVTPRLAKYGEHVDDHQLQIASAFEAKNYVLLAGETTDLAAMIVEAKIHKFDKYTSQRGEIVNTIKEFIYIHMKEK